MSKGHFGHYINFLSRFHGPIPLLTTFDNFQHFFYLDMIDKTLSQRSVKSFDSFLEKTEFCCVFTKCAHYSRHPSIYKREVSVCLFVCSDLESKLLDGSQPNLAWTSPWPLWVTSKYFFWVDPLQGGIILEKLKNPNLTDTPRHCLVILVHTLLPGECAAADTALSQNIWLPRAHHNPGKSAPERQKMTENCHKSAIV